MGVKAKQIIFFNKEFKAKLIYFYLWDWRQNLPIFYDEIKGKTNQFLIMGFKAKLTNFC